MVDVLNGVDIIILKQEELDAFVEEFGVGIFDEIEVYTEDDYTKGRGKYNLIQCIGNSYGVATQLHLPLGDPGDLIVDLS